MEEEADETDHSRSSYNSPFIVDLPSPNLSSTTTMENILENSPTLPSILDVPFYVWIRRITDPKNGRYPNGIDVKRIRELIEEQWRNASKTNREKLKKKSNEYWGQKGYLYIRLHNEVKAGRIERVAKGVYKGTNGNKEMKSELASPFDGKRKRQHSGTVCALCDNEIRDEAFIRCTKCHVHWHITCALRRSLLPRDFMKPNVDPKTLALDLMAAAKRWMCYDCKRCRLCDGSDNEENCLLICDHCDAAEHLQCQKPIPESVPYSPWYCAICRQSSKDSRNASPLTKESKILPSGIHRSSTQDKDLQQGHNVGPPGILRIGKITKLDKGPIASSKRPRLTDEYGLTPFSSYAGLRNLTGPEIRCWSVDKVHSVLMSIGYDSVAEVFKNEEIDGAALLLLKREDLIYKMNLKLGPALKANRFVNYLKEIFESSPSPLMA